VSVLRIAVGAGWLLLATAHALAAEPAQCESLRHHGASAQAEACFAALAHADSAYVRAEGDWGLGRYEAANQEFRTAVRQADGNALYRVRWGRLLHERFNDRDATDLFREALMRDARSAAAYLGLALVSADGFDDHALEWAHKALELDPHLTEAHVLLANLALEDSDRMQAAREADAALAEAADALDAMAVHASLELLADRSPEPWLERIRGVNPAYGAGYALIAHHLILNMRYEEGVDYYRKALQAEPKLWSARSELGINLMRLGQDAEARRQLESCYQNGYRDDATVNSLRLLDSYQNFVVFKDETTILKLHRKEADLLRPYFDAQLKRALAAYEQKYQMKLPGPVQVEVYPDHEDFAVRTLGMPGLGALGVTFGMVLAMDSPSGRKPGEFHWASTLRHEMSHVFILTATHHRVPRWFTEGLAVHEESQAAPQWRDPMTPEILEALRARKLLPVAELDRGFVRPEYPAQVFVSYFQAGRLCDYIQDHFGNAALLGMVHAYAKLESTRDAIQHNLGISAEDLDRQFQSWLYASVAASTQNLDAWHDRLKHLNVLAHEQQYVAVIAEGPAVVRLYPDYVFEGNAYELLAQAYLAQGMRAPAAQTLGSYAAVGGRDPATLARLADLQESLGDSAAAAATLDGINDIDPAFGTEPHRHLGALWLAQKNYAGAIREYRAVLALHPLDVASAQYELARAYAAAGERADAEDAVLAALEAAPGYRPAQKLLLQLQSP
jgi:tetratricopeptide (TPR) repeat protein